MNAIHRWFDPLSRASQQCLACVCFVALSSSLRAAQGVEPVHERLYMLDHSGSLLVTYDVPTMERLSLQIIGPLIGARSLTYGEGLLYTLNPSTSGYMETLMSIHPAEGIGNVIGQTGTYIATTRGIEYDPSSGRFFALYMEHPTWNVYQTVLHEIDAATGQSTFLDRVSGEPPVYFASFTMAINSKGEAFVSSFGVGPMIGRLDLETAEVSDVGRLSLGLGLFRDSAFDAQDRLWVLYDDIDDSKDGLYIVDPVALTSEPVLVTQDYPLKAMSNLAFVPLPPVSSFCAASTTAGCAPVIEWSGLPSASATAGFALDVRRTPSVSSGVIYWGAGAASTPFSGSGLCFAPPYHVTAPSPSLSANSGEPCDGTWSLELNPEIQAAGVFRGGDTLRAQWIGFDANAPAGRTRVISDALEFELAP